MMARKVQRMWLRPSQVSGGRQRTLHLAVVAVCFVGLLAGAATHRGGGLVIILAVLAASSVVHAVLVAHARYALPLVPVLIAGGIAGYALVLSSLTRPTRRSRSAPARAPLARGATG
jgi:hypothetical protein